MEMEPNIVKAQFIVTNSRIYTLEFDQNIEFRELKTMIQVAAHLKKNNFRLFCDGDEYTQYNDETLNQFSQIKNWLYLLCKKVKEKSLMKLNYLSK